MVFYSLPFLVFFIFFSLSIQTAKNNRVQNGIILIANIVFYAYWDYRFLLLLFGIITITYGCAYIFEKTGRGYWITIGVVIALATLGIFKYFNFFVSSFAKAFGMKDYVTLNLILPLGISFYLFEVLSYLFDLRKGLISFDRDYLKLAVYISFFPQITSGPIVNAHDFLPQLETLHRIKKNNVYEGIQQFLTGLTKKIVFADRIGVAVNAVYAAPAAYDGISILFAIIGYSLQIYFDFSGYSDMAIGIAKIWGFDLGKNFNAPYLAKNPSDFWGRWHISLSSWFKEYVYIPLGGNRKGKARTYFNLFITMILSGIWHGANITFVVWGAIHGVGSVINRMYRDITGKKKEKTIAAEAICIVLNCIFVSAAWVFFRASSVAEAVSIFSGLFRFTGLHYINVYVVCYSLFIGLIFTWSKYKNGGNIIQIRMNLDKFVCKIVFVVWVLAIVVLMYCGDSAFIYAQF